MCRVYPPSRLSAVPAGDRAFAPDGKSLENPEPFGSPQATSLVHTCIVRHHNVHSKLTVWHGISWHSEWAHVA